MGGSGTNCEPLIAALRSEPLEIDRDIGRGGKNHMGGKLRIRVFSWVFFQLFLTHTPKGASIQMYLGIGVERVMSFINLTFLRQSGKGTYLCPILWSEGS
jgi:hypothetical protein